MCGYGRGIDDHLAGVCLDEHLLFLLGQFLVVDNGGVCSDCARIDWPLDTDVVCVAREAHPVAKKRVQPGQRQLARGLCNAFGTVGKLIFYKSRVS